MNRAFSLNSALRHSDRNYSWLSAPEQGRVLPHPTSCEPRARGVALRDIDERDRSHPVCREIMPETDRNRGKSNPAMLGID
jgi:hypothetical protein